MSFRLEAFKLDEQNIQLPLVKLSKPSENEENFFTVVIGNNGTGKSRLLKGIVDSYRKRNIKNKHVSVQDELRNPKKIIAITTSLSDKFPPGSSFSRNAKPHTIKEKYCYLGPKGRVGGSSNRALMDKAISYLMSNADEKSNFHQYNEIFNYLQYEPVLKLVYKLRIPAELKNTIGSIDGETLKKFIRFQSDKRGGMRQGIFSRFLELPDYYWEELADAYRYAFEEQSFHRSSEFSFLINFSEENMTRSEHVVSSQEVSRYQVFDDLRKLELMRSMQVKLYKKHGGEFNYTDASSGEASILSTLIGLVPNLEDDSLILIDEPEISLHPSWQYRYIELVDRLLKSVKGCHVIIATHSHFLISDLPNGRSSVVHFKTSKGNHIDVDYYDENTNGMSAEDVLLNIFDMPSTRNYYLGAIVTESLELLAEGKKGSNRYRELKRKIRQVQPNLKKIDPLYDVISKLLELG